MLEKSIARYTMILLQCSLSGQTLNIGMYGALKRKFDMMLLSPIYIYIYIDFIALNQARVLQRFT